MTRRPFSADAAASPLTVEVTRDTVVESWHRGSAVVVDLEGAVVERWGDVGRPVFPRSAIKAFQALPVIESGAADAAGFAGAEIAILCGSHGGEPAHVDTVTGMLAKLDLTEADLECGPQWPSDPASTRALAAAGGTPDQRHNNCSGKHSGMLALARHLGAPTRGYIRPDHPVQLAIRASVASLGDIDLAPVHPGIDGCSVPTWPMPLDRLALAFARFATPDRLPSARGDACRRVMAAVFAHPFMVSGTDRFCTDVMGRLRGKAFIKSGAEGVFCAGLPGRGLGIALKCDDGAERGGRVMMAALLRRLGVMDAADEAALAHYIAPALRNRRDIAVGEIRPATHWPGPEKPPG